MRINEGDTIRVKENAYWNHHARGGTVSSELPEGTVGVVVIAKGRDCAPEFEVNIEIEGYPFKYVAESCCEVLIQGAKTKALLEYNMYVNYRTQVRQNTLDVVMNEWLKNKDQNSDEKVNEMWDLLKSIM